MKEEKIFDLVIAANEAVTERNALREEVKRLHAQNIELTKALATKRIVTE